MTMAVDMGGRWDGRLAGCNGRWANQRDTAGDRLPLV
jgi:hypothetical protein